MSCFLNLWLFIQFEGAESVIFSSSSPLTPGLSTVGVVSYPRIRANEKRILKFCTCIASCNWIEDFTAESARQAISIDNVWIRVL